jgi:palmitoyl-protein thioesterase
VESCLTKFPIRNFVTVGGPNNGVEYQNDCYHQGLIEMTRCQLQNLLSGLPIFSMYSSLLQKNVGPAGYHRDHSSMENYLAYSAFLPYLNNEKHHANYNQNKRRFEDLNHLLMIKFMYDPIIYPMESAFFGEIN